jgi:hypothetical protein
MKKNLIRTFLLIALIPLFSVPSYSLEVSRITPYFQLQYFKNTDNQRVLQATLTYSKNRIELPVPGMKIEFFTGTEKKNILATVVSDQKGIARFDLPGDMNFAPDNPSTWAFSSAFTGNDTIEAATAEIAVKDVSLEMVLSEADSVKTITVKAFVNEKGTEKPVSGEAVKVYVPRMFSLLPIAELTLDDSGTSSVEFPSDLPGDKEGNLTIIARFEENATFGNVERRETLKWGLPTNYSVPKSHRALWTKTPPKWMIYTLSILLAGVWGHYLFALISLIRIKLDAKRKAKAEYKI